MPCPTLSVHIADGVRHHTRDIDGEFCISLLYHRTEEFGGVLLTLVVPQDSNLQFLLVTEVLVVVHLSREEGIRLQLQGIVEDKIARSPT